MFKPVKKAVLARVNILSQHYLFTDWTDRELTFFCYWLQDTVHPPVCIPLCGSCGHAHADCLVICRVKREA